MKREKESLAWANLNGGELNGEDLEQIKQRSAHVPDRPKWRLAGTWAWSRRKEGAPSQGQPKWWRAGRGYQVTILKRGGKMVHSLGPA